MKRQNINSSNLSSVGYGADSLTLEMEFKNGRVYRYYDVPESVNNGLMSVSSKGKYLDRNIIKGGYSSSRL